MKPKKPKVQTFTFKTTRPIVSNSSTSSGDSGNTISTTDVNKIIKGSIKAGKKLKKTTRKIQKSITKAVKNYKKRQRAKAKAKKELLKASKRVSQAGRVARIDKLTPEKLNQMSGQELKEIAIRGFTQTKQQAYRMQKLLGVNEDNKKEFAREIIDPFGRNLSMKELKNIDETTEEGKKKLKDEIKYIRQVQDSPFLKKKTYEEFVTDRFKNIFSNLSDDTMKGEPQIGKFTDEDGNKVYGVKMNLLQFAREENVIDSITGMPTDKVQRIYEFKDKIYSVSDISAFLRRLNQLRKNYSYLNQDKTTLEEIYEAFEKAREEDISIVEAVDRMIKESEAKMVDVRSFLP